MGPYGKNLLLNGILAGYNSNGNNLIVDDIIINDVRNGSEYRCVIVNNMGTILEQSNLTLLYVTST